MGSNVTRQKRRAEFMRLPIAELAAWHLMVTCTSCRDARYLLTGRSPPGDALTGRSPTSCRGCGAASEPAASRRRW
jgi:hypothetical protein